MTSVSALPIGLRIYTLALLVVCVAACWAFVALYSKSFPWWRNQFGSHLVAFSTCLGLFLSYYLVLAFWPQMPWRVGIRTALFTLLTVVIVWRLVLFWRINRDERRAANRDGAS